MRSDFVARGYADMARLRSWYLADCPYADGWQRDAWQEGAWCWMVEQRTPDPGRGQESPGRQSADRAEVPSERVAAGPATGTPAALPRVMKITAKETQMLLTFASNDIVSDYGWESPEASAWNSDLCETRADAAVFGSLLAKGLFSSNGESVRLTDAGRETLRMIKAGK